MSCSSSILNNSDSYVDDSFYKELTKINIYDNMELLKMNDLREKNNKYNSNNKVNEDYLIPKRTTPTPKITSTSKPKSKDLKLDNNITNNVNNDCRDQERATLTLELGNNINNMSSYIDILINYFMLNVNDLKIKNSSFIINQLIINESNNNILFNNKIGLIDKSFGILTLINDYERTNLNALMKKIISYSNPKYQTFIITFILMDNFIETNDGLMYLENINKVFLSCFFIACYYFEDNGEYYKELLFNTEIQEKLVSIKDLTKVQNILCKLSPKDYDDYKSSFKSLYLQYFNNFNSLLVK